VSDLTILTFLLILLKFINENKIKYFIRPKINDLILTWALFASLEGKGREGKAKKKETSGKINKFEREGVWRVNFSS
jgi:hypothetical protein